MRDLMNNELKVGDTVHIAIGTGWAIGTIVKIQNGGLAVASAFARNGPQQQQGVTPDVLVVQCAVVCTGQPGQPQPGVVRIDAPNAVQSIVEPFVKM